MYETFFGLDETPFRLTPDPRYLFLSKRHREAIGHLSFGLRDGAGFVAITGEIGAGKTTLLRSVLRDADENVKYAYVLNPVLTGVELLQEINHELGILEEGGRRVLLGALNQYLLQQREADRQVVIVVDEAQALDGGILEQLRMLSNFETETSKLLQIVLVGQPELRQLLARPELTQLNQRITVRFHLTALDTGETGEYVCHRLSVASGGSTREIFTRSALRRIYHHTRGLPRLINQLCHRSLLVAFSTDHTRITRSIVDRAAGELGDSLGTSVRTARVGWLRLQSLGAVLLLAVGLFVVAGTSLRPMSLNWEGWRQRWSSFSAPAPDAESRAGIQVSPVELGEVSASELAPLAIVPKVTFAETGLSTEAARAALELDEALRGFSPGHSAYKAIESLLALWSVAPLSPGESAAGDFDLPAIAESRGLSYEPIEGDVELLRLLDLPAILEVGAGSDGAGARYGVLASVESGQVYFEFSGRRRILPTGVLDPYWSGRAHVFWADVDSLGPLLAEGARGPAVERLHLLLEDAGVAPAGFGSVFDAATVDAVAGFQTSVGLDADGKVGPLTLIALYRAGLPGAMPRLLTGVSSPASVPVAENQNEEIRR